MNSIVLMSPTPLLWLLFIHSTNRTFYWVRSLLLLCVAIWCCFTFMLHAILSRALSLLSHFAPHGKHFNINKLHFCGLNVAIIIYHRWNTVRSFAQPLIWTERKSHRKNIRIQCFHILFHWNLFPWNEVYGGWMRKKWIQKCIFSPARS